MICTNSPGVSLWSKGLVFMLVAFTSALVFAQVDIVIEIDVSVENEISINATDGLSAASVVDSNFTGFYFENLFSANGFVNGATLVAGDLTTSLNASNMNPLLFRGGAGGSDPGLNVWNFSTDDPVSFEANAQAFAGSGRWMVDSATYALFTSANPLGDIYFPADTADDVAQAQLIGSYMIVNDSGPMEIVPDSFTTFRGVLISGGLADVLDSDDSYLKHNPGFVLSNVEAPVWIEFEAALANDSPSSLELVFETTANTPGLTQTAEMFNWNTGAYVEVDVQAATFNNDTIVTIDLSGQMGDFVESGTGAVESRLGWRQTGFTILFPWTVCIDRVSWNASN